MGERNAKRSTKRIRTSMIVLTWVVAFVLLVYFFTYILKRQQNPNMHPVSMTTAKGVKQVTLKANNYHSFYVDGLINKHPVTFLLDTGATNVAIPSQLNTRLGLPQGAQVTVQTASGQALAYQTRIRTIMIGNIKLMNIKATLNPAFKANYVLLGMNALKQLEFIHKGNTLILRQNPR